jgi:O-antigen/teichoic acid export membrane protein
MSDDPKFPNHEKWKKRVHFLIHVLHIILALMLFVAALLNSIAGPTSLSLFALILYGIFISIFLVHVEVNYFCRLDKPCKSPDFVKRYLGFLGRGVLYQILGFPHMMDGHYRRYWKGIIGIMLVIFGVLIWSIGFCLMIIAIFAKAYEFADWIEEEEDESELQLESDDEDIGLLRNKVV